MEFDLLKYHLNNVVSVAILFLILSYSLFTIIIEVWIVFFKNYVINSINFAVKPVKKTAISDLWIKYKIKKLCIIKN